MKTNEIFRGARDLLERHELSTGSYAKNADGRTCGLNDKNVASLDLAAAMWRTCHADEEAFARAWRRFRSHVGWDVWDEKHKNSDFCRWLDNRSKQWHLDRLSELLEGREFTVTRSKDENLKTALAEYA